MSWIILCNIYHAPTIIKNFLAKVVNLNANNFEKTFWNYYLELERQYLEIELIIPFDEINYSTFSYKYRDLLWTICSEIDVLFREYMKIEGFTPDLDDEGNPIYNINQYNKFVNSKIQNFKTQEITCYNPKFNKKKIHPYKNWENEPPKWWQIYNKIKHNPEKIKYGKKAYKCANQICTLNALGGLFQLNLYIYKKLKENCDDEMKVPIFESNLFKLENWGNDYDHIINGRDASKAVDDLLDKLIKKVSEQY